MAAIQQVKRSQANEAKEAGGGSQTRRGQAGGGGQRPASQNAMVGGPSSQEERVALKQFLAATLLSTVKGKQARQEVKQALSRSLAKEEAAGAQQEATSVNPFEGGGRQRRTGTAASGEMLSDSAKWKSVYEVSFQHSSMYISFPLVQIRSSQKEKEREREREIPSSSRRPGT
jgi:hypothetical protein